MLIKILPETTLFLMFWWTTYSMQEVFSRHKKVVYWGLSGKDENGIFIDVNCVKAKQGMLMFIFSLHQSPFDADCLKIISFQFDKKVSTFALFNVSSFLHANTHVTICLFLF